MRKLVARLAVAGALAAFAVPALPCEGMKQTHASADTSEKSQKKEKVEKKQAEKKQAVASADAAKK